MEENQSRTEAMRKLLNKLLDEHPTKLSDADGPKVTLCLPNGMVPGNLKRGLVEDMFTIHTKGQTAQQEVVDIDCHFHPSAVLWVQTMAAGARIFAPTFGGRGA